MKATFVAGARPNFMKIAPLLRAADAAGWVSQLVHTGQHYDYSMSEAFFHDLDIREPDVNLHVSAGAHARQTGDTMAAFDEWIAEHPTDVVVVVGDVNSTVACSLSAVKRGIPVAHVEAGLRSFDRSMPEEINRVMVDAIAEWLLTPSPDADQNLLIEGHHPAQITCIGNVMVDSLEYARNKIDLDEYRERLGFPDAYGLVTLHRAALVDDPALLTNVLETLEMVAKDVPLVFPVHPRTRRTLTEMQTPGSNIQLVEPMGYLDFVAAQAGAKVVLTDSGGLQEETTSLGVPCITLREQTERPITVDEGTNVVVGFDRAKILAAADRALAGLVPLRRPALWDGHAAERAITAMSTRVDTVAFMPYGERG